MADVVLPSRAARTPALLLAGLLVCTLTGLPAAPARAEETGGDVVTHAPVTSDDALTVRSTPAAGPGTLLDVLANDSDADGDDLEICRVVVPEGSPLRVSEELVDRYPAPGGGEGVEQLVVEVDVNRATTATFSYYACDRASLTPATVTVSVRPTLAVRGRTVPGRPGRVRFTNPGDRRVVVLYGGPRQQDADGRVALAPGAAGTVRVQRRRLLFIAVLQSSGRLVNSGRVRGIRLRGDRSPLTPTGPGRRAQQVWHAAVRHTPS